MLVILVMMAAAGTMGMSGYIRHAKQTARDSVARTVFMAAQTALTHQYNQDRDFYLHNFNPEIPGPDYTFLPDGEAEKQTHSPKPALVYLKLDKGASNEGLPLYSMLSPYLNDKSILNDSILIEYNRETGMMLSAFYSEMEGVSFGYGTGGSYDVRGRADTDAREEALVGFYGVDGTGEVIRANPINAKDYEVRLVDYVNYQTGNYGLLTAEITMPADVTEIQQWAFLLTLIPAEGAEETVTFSWNDANTDFRIQELVSGTSTNDPVADAIDNPRIIGGRKIPVYCETAGTKRTVVIVLDGVQSFGSETDIGIRTNFPKLINGALSAMLIITDGSESEILYSEDYSTAPVHVLYGGNSDENKLTVQTVRHLNNIRYCGDDSAFVQEQNVYMWDYAHAPINFTPLCNRFNTYTKQGGDTDYGFLGSYRVDTGLAIYDLHIDLTQQGSLPDSLSDRLAEGDTSLYNAGLFDTVRSGARISGVRYASSSPVTGEAPRKLRVALFTDDVQNALSSAVMSVKGVQHAGGIAGVNEGTITNCTVMGSVTADLAKGSAYDGAAGGIAGSNENGSITKCAAMCAVSANMYAGGIAGRSTGTVSLCEAGTASWRSAEDAKALFRSGTPVYGATGDAPSYAAGTYTANNVYHVKIMRDGGMSGGIVGDVSGTNAKVTGCVNACKVEAGNYPGDAAGVLGDGMGGGIVGRLTVSARNYIAVGWNYNAGEVYATGCAGGLVGSVGCGWVAYGYNTGYVNWEFNPAVTYSNDVSYYLPRTPRNFSRDDMSPHRFGGLIGEGSADTTVSDCYSMQYAGDRYGGAFGVLHKGASVTNCAFQLNVWNNTKEYYVTDTEKKADNVNALQIYSVENLRKAPSEGNLDSTYFSNGDFISPAGVFKYKFPYLTSSPDGALPAHRTPWRPSIESYGNIRFSKGNLVKKGAEIIATFYLAPPEGKIILRCDANPVAGKDMDVSVIPLYKQKDFNSLTDLRNDPGKWLDIYGYTTENEADFDVAHRNYILQIRATKLVATDSDDAIRIAAGFTYRYELRMYNEEWQENDPAYHTAIPVDATYLKAELYNDYKPGNGYTHDAFLGTLGELQMIDPNNAKKSGVLSMRIGRVLSTQSVRVTFTYDDGLYNDKRFVNLSAAMLNAAALPTTYDGALDSQTARVGFTTDGVTSTRFPFYMKDGTIYLVLWTDDEDVNHVTRPMATNLPQWAKILVTVELQEPGRETVAWERSLDGWGAPQ